MKSKIAFTFVLISIVLTISALWLQVRALKASVDQLRQATSAAPLVQPITVQTPESDRATEQKKSPFKLIEVSNVGVPWSIEQAMINEGSVRRATLQR